MMGRYRVRNQPIRRAGRGSTSKGERDSLRMEERLETRQHIPEEDGSCPICGHPEFHALTHCWECNNENESD